MSAQLPAALYSDLLVVPYVEKGRDMRGLDCVGLFVAIQRRLGRWLPLYESDAALLEIAMQDWERVDSPQPGDGVLLRSTSPRWHLATVIGGNLMIHAKEEAGVVVERIDTPLYARRIEGFYRWKPKAYVRSAS
jgi:cell wall-associated NlpC family hydrolase